MTRNIGTQAVIDQVRLEQQTSHPASPDSGYEVLYVISGSSHGGLYLKDSSGRQIGPFITGSSSGGGITMDDADPYAIFHRLDTPDADDDEFAVESLTGTWTQVNPTGVVTWVENRHVLSAVFSGQSANDVGAILKAMALADGEALETTLKMLAKKLTNYTMAGLIISDGTATTSNAMGLFVYQTSVADEIVLEVRTGTLTNMSTSATSFIASNGSPNGTLRLQILRNSSTSFSPRVSTEDGAQFTTFGMSNVNPGFTPTHAGLFVTVWGGANSGIAAFDYIRIIPA